MFVPACFQTDLTEGRTSMTKSGLICVYRVYYV